jgi:hypothetical protein
MLRLATLFWMAVAIGVGLLLYNVKHEVQGLEQLLVRTNRAIHATQERIHVLEAEWSLLNEPERLRALSSRHLDLVPMRPAQFVEPAAIAALPAAAPRADTAVAEAETGRPQPAATAASATPPTAARPAEQRREPRTGEPPSRLAPQREEPLPPPRQAAPQPRRELEAGAPRPLLPGAAPAASPRPAMPVVPVAAPSVAPPLPSAPPRPTTTSSLGAPAAALPPPVPVQR